MPTKKRIYDSLIDEHLSTHRQMLFLSGPRQVGKTTTCRRHADAYLNWDNVDHREIILAGPERVAAHLGLDRLRERMPVVLFDELHKYPRWKAFLKGFHDTYADRIRILVTGSSRMDTYRRGGDSLMGRYFHYRMHPFSIAELLHRELPDPARIIRPPRKLPETDMEALWQFGGFPEPFLKRDARFSRRWQSLRLDQLVREDIRDLTQVQQLGQIEALIHLLVERSGQQLVYSNLARQIRVSVDTAHRWIDLLCSLHLGFLIRPWYRNVSRSLRKEPKWYLRDWAQARDRGQRAETFVACHLLKAVEAWTDLGLGKFELGYIRDKNKREVDFIVTRDDTPWFLVEVKHGQAPLSEALTYFRQQLAAPHAFQVTLDMPYVKADCFAKPGAPLIVPARTFLSQLL